MKQNKPKNWPGRWIYSPESVGMDINIELLRLVLSATHQEDQYKITPCIEEKKVHPHLEIRKITPRLLYKGPRPHPLAHLMTIDRQKHCGIFANKKIPKDTGLGEFVGKMRLLNYSSARGRTDTYNLIVNWKNQHLVCIDSRKIANEMMCVNDYRGLQEAPNAHFQWMVNRGFYYCCYATSRDIEPDEEIVSYYGPDTNYSEL